MRKTSALLLLLSLFVGPAKAHQDRIVQIGADGSILDIPPALGPVRLIVKGLGSTNPFVQLRIGAHQTTLPDCVARTIRSTKASDIQVSGSWYHDEKRSLPYYLNIRFFDPGYDRTRAYNSGREFLFNLHDASLIHAQEFKANGSGNGGQSRALQLPAGCDLKMEKPE
jgi:hypothetical protein